MNFALFILVNAALFIRPSEVIPALEDWQVYHYLILACLAVSVPQVVAYFRGDTLSQQPITVCVVALWGAVSLSHLANGSVGASVDLAWDFAKLVIYYLLLVALVDSAARYRSFLVWLTGFIFLVAIVGVAQYHEVVEIPGLTTLEDSYFDEDEGELVILRRLRCTGLFNDPNDVCLILTLGILLCLYFLGEPDAGRRRWLWAVPLGLFGYTMVLTQSRGGLLGLFVGLLFLIWSRWGWWKTFLLAAVLAVAASAAGVRQLNFDLASKDDTGQERVALWVEGLISFQTAPVFGIGAKNFADEHGWVAHNSYLHGFAELGFLGGALFVSAFVFALWQLNRLRRAVNPTADPGTARLLVFIMAIVAAYATGIYTLSRNYTVPTYLVLGLASVLVLVCSRRSGGQTVASDERQAGSRSYEVVPNYLGVGVTLVPIPVSPRKAMELPSMRVDRLFVRVVGIGAVSIVFLYVSVKLLAKFE